MLVKMADSKIKRHRVSVSGAKNLICNFIRIKAILAGRWVRLHGRTKLQNNYRNSGTLWLCSMLLYSVCLFRVQFVKIYLLLTKSPSSSVVRASDQFTEGHVLYLEAAWPSG